MRCMRITPNHYQTTNSTTPKPPKLLQTNSVDNHPSRLLTQNKLRWWVNVVGQRWAVTRVWTCSGGLRRATSSPSAAPSASPAQKEVTKTNSTLQLAMSWICHDCHKLALDLMVCCVVLDRSAVRGGQAAAAGGQAAAGRKGGGNRATILKTFPGRHCLCTLAQPYRQNPKAVHGV